MVETDSAGKNRLPCFEPVSVPLVRSAVNDARIILVKRDGFLKTSSRFQKSPDVADGALRRLNRIVDRGFFTGATPADVVVVDDIHSRIVEVGHVPDIEIPPLFLDIQRNLLVSVNRHEV